MPEKTAARVIERKTHKSERERNDFVRVLSSKMAIVTLSDALLTKGAGKPGTILRDKVLCGLCLRVGRRTQTFCVATSVTGKQVRLTLGRWPLITVEQARELALPILRACRSGEFFAAKAKLRLPTLTEVLDEYAKARKVKDSSLERYRSLLRTHFSEWLERPASSMASAAFSSHCHDFAQSKGSALVDLGRGLIGSLLKYIGAVYGATIESPFSKLSTIGLMPKRPGARKRKLQEKELPHWKGAVDKLPELQRDYLVLMLLTGLRRNEETDIQRKHVDLVGGELAIPTTKNGQPHSLPITPPMREILERRCEKLEPDALLFDGVAADHVAEMATRLGAPVFRLHDLRKQLATAGARIGIPESVLRRILGHKSKRDDVLQRHYIQLIASDIANELEQIQKELLAKCLDVSCH